jgi:transcription elongation factor SPT6
MQLGEGIVQHIRVMETGKSKGNELGLGEKLRINKETYDDLDEILARFIDPMKAILQDVTSDKHYSASPVEQVGKDLQVRAV